MVPGEAMIVLSITFWSRNTWSRVRKFNLPIFIFFHAEIFLHLGRGLGTLAHDVAAKLR
jgi:hypothetical protein